MHILLLGPSCPRIEERLAKLGHSFLREENPISPDFFSNKKFDFAVSYGYGYILTPEVLAFFQDNNIINLHMSLLPWNRGREPNIWSFLENTPKGVTIHNINAGVDKGEILLQREIHFDIQKETLRTTWHALAEAVENLFLEYAEDLLAKRIPSHKQECGGSYHSRQDKIPYLPLIEEKCWDTPVSVLIGKAQKNILDI